MGKYPTGYFKDIHAGSTFSPCPWLHLLTRGYYAGESIKSGGISFITLTQDGSSRGSQCLDDSNNPDPTLNFGLENYGDGSICIEQGSAWQQRTCTVLKQVRLG